MEKFTEESLKNEFNALKYKVKAGLSDDEYRKDCLKKMDEAEMYALRSLETSRKWVDMGTDKSNGLGGTN